MYPFCGGEQGTLYVGGVPGRSVALAAVQTVDMAGADHEMDAGAVGVEGRKRKSVTVTLEGTPGWRVRRQ